MSFRQSSMINISTHFRTTALWFLISIVGVIGLSGCQELNSTVDGVLGKGTPAHAASHEVAPYHQYPGNDNDQYRVPIIGQLPVRKKTTPSQKKTSQPTEKTPSTGQKAGVSIGPKIPGKKREPGAVTPETQAKEVVQVFQSGQRSMFRVDRDPFRQPTEILPSECPPSMPLCKYDRSQIKLVGIIQVSGGQFKGMVEDPDGRGYFVGTGMQIGGATVTQITNKGITLHVHKSGQDVPIPLFQEGKQLREF